MSDYFLNKIYDSLLKRKLPQTKSTFNTLSESYIKIYEQTPSPTHDDPSQIPDPETPVTADIPPPPPESSVSSKTVNWNKNTTQTTLVQWTPDQANLYRIKDSKKDTGPGEYSIASLISGEVNEEILNKMISGGTKSYDVSYPNAEDPKAFRYEVKQEEIDLEKGAKQSVKDVRIAKLGNNVYEHISKEVGEILKTIKSDYELLTPENQKAADRAVLEKLGAIKEPEPGVTATGKARLRPTTGVTSKYQKQLKEREDWSIGKFVNVVGFKDGELPFTYLLQQKYEARRDNRQHRGMYPLMSLEKFLDICNELSVNKVEKEDESTERVQGIKNTFKRFYSTSSEEKNEILDNTFEKEAEGVDKRLTKVKIKQEGGINIEEFFNSIKKEKLKEKFNELKEYIVDPKTVRSMFPDGKNSPVSIEGLFVVDPKGWKYVTSEDIGNIVVITRISQGKPKIILKGNDNI